MKNDRPTGMNALVMNSRKEIFSNPGIREAFSYAYDHEWINKTLNYDAYTRTDSYFDNSPLASSGLPTKEDLDLLNPWKNQWQEEILTKNLHSKKFGKAFPIVPLLSEVFDNFFEYVDKNIRAH